MLSGDSELLVQFLLALGAVLFLIVLIAWILKKVNLVSSRIGRLGEDARLSVSEAVAVDHRRRLVLVRRDHVEHLVLIGGENDLLLEHAIPAKPQPAQPQPALAAQQVQGQTQNQAQRPAVPQGTQQSSAQAAQTTQAHQPRQTPQPATPQQGDRQKAAQPKTPQPQSPPSGPSGVREEQAKAPSANPAKEAPASKEQASPKADNGHKSEGAQTEAEKKPGLTAPVTAAIAALSGSSRTQNERKAREAAKVPSKPQEPLAPQTERPKTEAPKEEQSGAGDKTVSNPDLAQDKRAEIPAFWRPKPKPLASEAPSPEAGPTKVAADAAGAPAQSAPTPSVPASDQMPGLAQPQQAPAPQNEPMNGKSAAGSKEAKPAPKKNKPEQAQADAGPTNPSDYQDEITRLLDEMSSDSKK